MANNKARSNPEPSAATPGKPSTNPFDGLAVEDSIRLLATEIEAISPPTRSWEWIADWMASQGIVGKYGKPVLWQTLQSIMCNIRKEGIIDTGKAERLRKKLIESSFAAADIGLALETDIPPGGNEALAAAKRDILRRGSLEIRGLTVRQSLARLANSVAIIKPPLRSWDWLAEWLIREGVRPEDGHSPITGSSVGESWRRGAGEFQAKGLADPARAESVRERILGELLTEKEIAKILREQSKIKSSLPPDMDSADARLLRDALGSVKGMSLEQALLRLSKPIAILKPPVRQWSWIADWMSEQEVGARAGATLTGLSVSKAWSVAKSKGLIDDTHAGPMRDRILDEPISDREVRAMLSGAAKPAASPSSSGASFEPEASLLSPWLESPEGQFMTQACLRLANAIAFARPPLRSWEWIAEWLEENGVVNRKGGRVHGKRIRALFGKLEKEGRADCSAADKARLSITKSISDDDLKAILETRIGPARLDRLQPQPKKPKPKGP